MITTNVENIENAFRVASRFRAPIGKETFFAFRGHSNAEYELAPTLTRLISGKNFNERDAIALEERLTYEYRRRSRHLRPRKQNGVFSGSDDSEIDLWQTMQHHGAPTRLLDWTRSFYVALYFAVVGSPKYDASVSVINLAAIDKWEEVDHLVRPHNAHGFEKHLDDKPRPLLYSPIPDFERAVVQQGLFTIPTHLLCDHDKLFRDAHSDAGHEMERVLIRRDCKPLLLSQLIAMNLTAASLFPDINGIARSISCLLYTSDAADE